MGQLFLHRDHIMALRATAARRGMLTPVLNYAATAYANSLGKQLKKYGLQFEDIYVTNPEVEEALRRIPAAEREGRSMRIRRAVDPSFKRMYLPADMQAA